MRGRKQAAETEALIDSGSMECLVSPSFVERVGMTLIPLRRPIILRNADESENSQGRITHYVVLKYLWQGAVKLRLQKAYVASIGKHDVILGMTWLEKENPSIDWKTGNLIIRTVKAEPPPPPRWKGTLERLQRAKSPVYARTPDPAETTKEEPPTISAPRPVLPDLKALAALVVKRLEEESRIPTDILDEPVPELPGHPVMDCHSSSPLRKVTIEEEPEVLEDEEPFEATVNRIMENLDADENLLSYDQEAGLLTSYSQLEPPLTQETWPPSSSARPSTTVNRYLKTRSGKLIPMAFSVGKVTTSTELAQKAHEKDKEKTLEEMVPPYLHDLLPVFDKQTASRLPEHTEYDHEINLKPGFESMKAQVYPIAPAQRAELEKFIQENESKGYIRPSKSPIASPFFFVGKKDGTYRPCQDYRTLNANTIKDRYPLPLVTDLMEKMKGAKYFTKMDLRAGYNNVRIKEGDEWKAAFIVPGTNHGPPRLFEPTVMFFGLCNSPSTFQRMMNTIFADMMQEGWIVIYMDDILIFSADLEEHRKRTRRVIERLKEHDLYLKPEKCYFDVPEVEFLGLIIRHNEIAMDPVKIDGVVGWKPPTCLKDVRSFLGFANFYRRFIPHFSDRARPLVDLTKKDVRWHWDDEQQKAFDDLKAEFVKAPVLKMPEEDKPFALETDASKFATGGVLRQQDNNGDWHPCGYISQSLNPAERNYEIYDRELLAIIRGLETWKHLLMGAAHPVQILCDHKNLGYWRTAQKLNRRQARWALFLSEFDYELIHVPGSKMVQSDALSRRPDHDPGDNDNEDMVVLPDSKFARSLAAYRTIACAAMEEEAVITMDDRPITALVNQELHDRIANCHVREPIVRDAITALFDKGPPPARTALADWMTDGNLVYYRDKLYVPLDKEL